MSTISTQLRNFKEPTREQLNLLFFALPLETENYGRENGGGELETIEVGAILSLGVQGVEEAYVRILYFYFRGALSCRTMLKMRRE